MLKLKDCSSCGYVTEADVASCPSCGGSMVEGMPAEEVSPPAPGRRRALRWVGALLVPALFAIGFMADHFTSPRRDDGGAVVQAGRADVFDLRVGDCLVDWDAEVEEVTEAGVVPCGEPHSYEVFANVTHPGNGPFPGLDSMVEYGDQACYEPFAAYVGIAYEDSELYFSYLYPTEESWREGDRILTCVLLLPDGELVGSMRGAVR